MGTLIKIVVAAILSILMSSCQFDINLGGGKKGNGNVTTESRTVSGTFTIVDASEGLDVVIIQGEQTNITVEADENIIHLIETDIKNNTLKIHTSEQIGRAKSKKITVTLPVITKIESSSGADIENEGNLSVDDITLNASSGSDIEISLQAHKIEVNTSSGADIDLYGSAESIYAEASSGSDITASELMTKNAYAKASSGGDVKVNCSEMIEARSSSGGNVTYTGNPKVVQKNSGVSGNINQN